MLIYISQTITNLNTVPFGYPPHHPIPIPFLLSSYPPGHAHAEGVDEQLREADDLQAGADEGGRDDVVDEEGAVVGQEDTFPAVRLTLRLDGPLHERPGTDNKREGGSTVGDRRDSVMKRKLIVSVYVGLCSNNMAYVGKTDKKGTIVAQMTLTTKLRN